MGATVGKAWECKRAERARQWGRTNLPSPRCLLGGTRTAPRELASDGHEPQAAAAAASDPEKWGDSNCPQTTGVHTAGESPENPKTYSHGGDRLLCYITTTPRGVGSGKQSGGDSGETGPGGRDLDKARPRFRWRTTFFARAP